ncbi:MAG TPA: hypothetical protein VD772_02125 [Anseongella sp.]|nr:hypothetical protein [Anseongella sp.]
MIFPSAYGQDASARAESKLSLDSGTIASQFDYITAKSNSFQEYKVVRKTWLAKLESNITDSLNAIKNELAEMRTAAAAQKSQMSALQASLETANADLETARATKDSISLLGIQTGKTYYNSIMWAIVLGLGALLAFFVYRSARNGAITAEAVRTLQETKEEFDLHRKKALEREQKLNRRLQDELNKQLR